MWWMISAVLAQPYQARVLYPCTGPLEEYGDYEPCPCDPFEKACPEDHLRCSRTEVIVAGGPRVLSQDELTRVEVHWPTPTRTEQFANQWDVLLGGPQCGGLLPDRPDS